MVEIQGCFGNPWSFYKVVCRVRETRNRKEKYWRKILGQTDRNTGTGEKRYLSGIFFCTPSGETTYAPLDEAEGKYRAKKTEILGQARKDISPYAPLDEAEGIYFHQLKAPLFNGSQYDIDDIIRQYDSKRRQNPALLHISDLHFGTKAATGGQSYLESSIETTVRDYNIKRVIITGDLFDNPNELNALLFKNFRESLHRSTGLDPIVVPGNHDRKKFGNFKWSLKALSELNWSPIIKEDALEILFFCFDSSKGATLAKGKVSRGQRLSVASSYEALLRAEPKVERYAKVALLHHHPFSFHTPAMGIWKLFEPLGIKEESFLRLENGDDFLKWCASRKVDLILHGYKHVPYHAHEDIYFSGGSRRIVTVGCGTSTGAGGYPFSMNVIKWVRNCWIAQYLIDPGDGSGFTNYQLTTLGETGYPEI